jgi:hypothetical protein
VPSETLVAGDLADALAYQRRKPEDTVLYRVVQHNLETFLVSARDQGRVVPRFVEREFRAFLDCGLLCRGFLRVRCDDCGRERLVAYSCKCRGFCPSCGARRMADTAAHLVDRVFPEVPVRQYVLSLPFALRYRLAFDQALCSEVLRIFVQSVFTSLKRRARKNLQVRKAYCGAVTFLQRSGGSINLNPHYHSLILDGVYISSLSYEAPRFHPLPPPTDEEIARITAAIAQRVEKLLVRKGLLGEDAPTDPDPREADEPLLSQLYSASVQGRVAAGPRAGQRLLRLGDRIDVEDVEAITGQRCASVQGFSLHTGVCVPARDRRRLERLVRYRSRGPTGSARAAPAGQHRSVSRHPGTLCQLAGCRGAGSQRGVFGRPAVAELSLQIQSGSGKSARTARTHRERRGQPAHRQTHTPHLRAGCPRGRGTTLRRAGPVQPCTAPPAETLVGAAPAPRVRRGRISV